MAITHRVVESQLPHTLDLTWFEPLDGEQDFVCFQIHGLKLVCACDHLIKSIGWELKEPVEYKFKEFPYYETRKNEALFREYVKACEQVTRRRNILSMINIVNNVTMINIVKIVTMINIVNNVEIVDACEHCKDDECCEFCENLEDSERPQSPACWSPPYTESVLERTACVRSCINQACYADVYGDDPLEEVRLLLG